MTIPERNDIHKKDMWDLSPLFENDDQWESLFSDIESKMDRFNEFRGTLGGSSDNLYNALMFDLEVSRDIEKLYTYIHLRHDEDQAHQENMARLQRTMNLYRRISEISSYLTPELHSIPEAALKQFLSEDRFKEYEFYFEKILRYRPHVLSEEIEEILAMSADIAGAPSQLFSQLDNVDMKFGTVTDDEGKKTELSHGNFITFLMSPKAEIRKNAFHTYYAAYNDHKHTIATSLSSSIKKDLFYSRVRKHESTLKSKLFSDNVPISVYDNLVQSVRDNFAPLFKYLGHRKKLLGLDELHFYDTYVPLVSDVKFSMKYDEAVDICIDALAPLGEEYTSRLKEGLLGGWVDRYENRGKRSGAYSSGCYDSPPYILMNYEEKSINSVYTLIHEAGHSMHSLYSKETQPYHYADYTIFVAEVASTFNETLLSRHLLNIYKDDPAMKAYILNREIDNIRGTLYRQTMFAEFERRAHQVVQKNDPLTLDVMTGIYSELLEAYFGDAIVIDPELEMECLRIPHFYSSFYVYKYATGISAAIALAHRVLSGEKGTVDKYLSFLKLGGTMFPIDELKAAGVDMEKPEPVNDALSHFGRLVDEFIATYT